MAAAGEAVKSQGPSAPRHTNGLAATRGLWKYGISVTGVLEERHLECQSFTLNKFKSKQ